MPLKKLNQMSWPPAMQAGLDELKQILTDNEWAILDQFYGVNDFQPKGPSAVAHILDKPSKDGPVSTTISTIVPRKVAKKAPHLEKILEALKAFREQKIGKQMKIKRARGQSNAQRKAANR